jgi:hypothetical protein
MFDEGCYLDYEFCFKFDEVSGDEVWVSNGEVWSLVAAWWGCGSNVVDGEVTTMWKMREELGKLTPKIEDLHLNLKIL